MRGGEEVDIKQSRGMQDDLDALLGGITAHGDP